MSFNLAVGSIATGLGLTVYGGYKHLTASQKPANEASQQKKLGLGFVATGIAAIAVGAGLIYSRAMTTQIPENPIILSSIPTFSTLASTIEEVASCPINALRNILNQGGSESITAKTFKVLEDTQGISCDNYLPWQSEFHRGETGYIDGIRATHLQKPTMWGIDEWKRPYVAIKYVCDLTTEGAVEGAVALFQRYTGSGSLVVSGGHFRALGCYLGPLEGPINTISSHATEFLGNLTSLFKGENVVSPRWSDKVFILTLAK